MKKQLSLLFIAVLLIFGCSNEEIGQVNEELVAAKFLEIITNPELQNAIAQKSLTGKSLQQKSSIDADDAFIIRTDIGLVFIQFAGTKVFGFVGVNGSERIKEKNGEVQFDSKANKVFCAVANALTRTVEFSNLCPKNANGFLVANGRLMPEDLVLNVPTVGAIYKVNGASIINAKNIAVNNATVGYISVETNPSLALEQRLVCGANGTNSATVSLKSETDIYGNNIELTYSLN